ncbi:MAG TPA: AMP-binding protein, partial [Anaerolineaceae bacterium]|nr:AMP-binding protein [Anaerolineaceae bacterium]
MKKIQVNTIRKQELLNNFWYYVRSAADFYGEKPFVINKFGVLTFKQNNNNANVIHQSIISHTIEKGIGVGLFMNNPLNIIPSMIGVIKSNNFFIPLDTTFPNETLKQNVNIGKVKIILTDSLFFENAKSIIPDHSVVIINVEELDFSVEVSEPDIKYSPEDLVQVLFTSGSTDEPKGAIEDYRYLVRAVAVKLNSGDFTTNDITLQLSKFTYSAPHTHAFSALISGTSLYYHDLKEDGFLALPDLIRQHKITVVTSTPTVFRGFVNILKPDETFPNVRLIRGGGEKRLLEDFKAIHQHFPNVEVIRLGYASTETQVVSSSTYPISYPFKEGTIPAGHPLDDIKVSIWDENSNELPIGEEGEIVVYGDALARGYINNPILTQKHFIPDPDNTLYQYFKSGDLGKILPDGQLLHLGRIDNMVKIKGVRIELSTLENHILSYPGITQVASKAIEDGQGRIKLASYFVAEKGIDIPISDLRKYLMDR